MFILPFIAVPSKAVEDSTPKQAIGPFGTLNNADDPLVLSDNMAQDLLNVEITDQGRSVRKRKGVGLAYTLPISTSPTHGIYSFYDSAGNDVSLFFNDRYLTGSVNGAAITTIFSTGTVDATWDCTDSLGYAYCTSTARGALIKTDGVNDTEITTVSNGTMVTATTERLVMAGFSGAPSQINFSGANDFTNWTLGGEPTSPYNETINAPGSRITHIAAACNGLMWFKETSFGIILNPDDALAAQNVILAPEIGTLDNTSVIYPGGIQFRAQDGHIYNYDCAGIEKLTRDITPTINTSGSRTSNSWTQTTQSDFSSGAVSPVLSLSTSIVSGSVIPSSITLVDTSSGNFNLGSMTSIDTTTVIGSFTLKTYFSDTFTNFSNWTSTNTVNSPQPWTTSGNQAFCSPSGGGCMAYTLQTVSPDFFYESIVTNPSSEVMGVANNSSGYCTFITATSLGIYKNSNIGSTVCSVGGTLLSSATLTVASGSRIAMARDSSSNLLSVYLNGVSTITATDSTYTSFSALYIKAFNSGTPSKFSALYDVARSGNFISRELDSSFSTPFWGTLSAGTSGSGIWSFATRTSATSGSGYNADVSVSTGSVISSTKVRYLVYSSTLTALIASSLPQVTDVTIIAASTGSYYSSVHNAPSLSSWDTFNVTSNNTDGSHSFYIRSSTNPFTVLSTTPSWVSQSAGGIISASTGTYFQMRDDFSISYATSAISLDDFTFNWFEGVADDKSYGIYFGKDNALWWSVPVGSGQSTNNRILRYDLVNRGWVLYDIPANGFLIRNQNLYVGSANAGKIWKFGDTDSDENTAINSYWKSKDFSFDPMVDKEFTTLSVIAKSVASSSMTVTYTVDGSSSTSYTVPLYNANSTIMRNNRYLPAGRSGNTLNVQFGNNAADQYWELFGGIFGYKKKPWITGN